MLNNPSTLVGHLHQTVLKEHNLDGKSFLFVCLMLNDPSTLVGHLHQMVLKEHNLDGKSFCLFV